MRDRFLLATLLLLAGVAAVFMWLQVGGGESFETVEVDPGAAAEPSGIQEVEHAEAIVAGERLSPRQRDFSEKNVVSEDPPGESVTVTARLREMQRRDDEGLEVVTMPDGHQSIDLKGRFQHVTRLVVAEDGSLVPVCGVDFSEEEADD